MEGHANHFSCSLTAVLIARVHAAGGPQAVERLLQEAGSPRTVEYLTDIANWVSYDEAEALWEAGRRVTHHPNLPRAVGEDAARRLNASPVASLLRSLGSPEAVYEQIAITSGKFTTVTTMEAVEVGPGFADINAHAIEGLERSAAHCEWTRGLLTQPPVLFGYPPATVIHERCQAHGAPSCRYSVRWEAADQAQVADHASEALRAQLDAMRERLRSMFATASDLIAADDLSDVLVRITDRAAIEVRAPRYLLAVRAAEGEQLLCHHKGVDADQVQATAEQLLAADLDELPESWLVAPVRSTRREYGRLLAMAAPDARFFDQERELFAVYAQYAASALDSATALAEAKRRYAQSSALLDLARALATAGTSDDVARRLAEAVPMVVDCDLVSVYLWDPVAGQLRLRTSHEASGADAGYDPEDWTFTPQPGGPLEQWLTCPSPEPMFVDAESGHPVLRELAARVDAVASIVVPLATNDSLLGLLSVWVTCDAQRLTPTPDLLHRLSGVAAQATSALQNGRLVDQITHQARHDQLTGLANRLQFADTLHGALARSQASGEPMQLFYIDLDGFKPVNDEFGHEIGDKLLVGVGNRLLGCTRAGDTVARLGGDEFAVLVDAPDAGDLVQRFRDALERPFAIGGHELRISASIGVAAFPADAQDAEALLRAADAEMFVAKRARRLVLPPVAQRA